MREKIAIFASGSGSNFEAIMKEVQTKHLSCEVALVFSDNQDAYILERAKKYEVPVVCFHPKDFSSKKVYEEKLLLLLKARQINWVVLAGYLRILGETIIDAYPNKIINIHPSLLPEYPGLKSIERAWHDKKDQTGVTIHFVDKGMDTGPIIVQESLAMYPKETLASLTSRVHDLEHQLYPAVIRQLLNKEKINE